ncbi:hypothetical protein OB236_02690 [Paenibacillus sp. WQ 127069]|uniref:Uncharacterized protein n=1 Tax=Paenibacillus baimaensis TaxID=2982185 RepID=A0ABT2U8R4_9BACL|nr:hypothetical protein [Paenibacillus sp. WQ 127069]MCU6791028.1 hypothetical protein [Paenibacillus sp. WQ 127069]
MMKKTNVSSIKKIKMLVGTLTFAFMLSGGSAVMPVAMAASSVGMAIYDTFAPIPLALGPGLADLDRDALLEVMNLTPGQLRQELESGQSLSEIAISQGSQHVKD